MINTISFDNLGSFDGQRKTSMDTSANGADIFASIFNVTIMAAASVSPVTVAFGGQGDSKPVASSPDAMHDPGEGDKKDPGASTDLLGLQAVSVETTVRSCELMNVPGVNPNADGSDLLNEISSARSPFPINMPSPSVVIPKGIETNAVPAYPPQADGSALEVKGDRSTFEGLLFGSNQDAGAHVPGVQMDLGLGAANQNRRITGDVSTQNLSGKSSVVSSNTQIPVSVNQPVNNGGRSFAEPVVNKTPVTETANGAIAFKADISSFPETGNKDISFSLPTFGPSANSRTVTFLDATRSGLGTIDEQAASVAAKSAAGNQNASAPAFAKTPAGDLAPTTTRMSLFDVLRGSSDSGANPNKNSDLMDFIPASGRVPAAENGRIVLSPVPIVAKSAVTTAGDQTGSIPVPAGLKVELTSNGEASNQTRYDRLSALATPVANSELKTVAPSSNIPVQTAPSIGAPLISGETFVAVKADPTGSGLAPTTSATQDYSSYLASSDPVRRPLIAQVPTDSPSEVPISETVDGIAAASERQPSLDILSDRTDPSSIARSETPDVPNSQAKINQSGNESTTGFGIANPNSTPVTAAAGGKTSVQPTLSIAAPVINGETFAAVKADTAAFTATFDTTPSLSQEVDDTGSGRARTTFLNETATSKITGVTPVSSELQPSLDILPDKTGPLSVAGPETVDAPGRQVKLNPTAIEMPPEQSSTVSNAAIDGRDWLSSGDTAMADDGTPSDVSNLTVRVGSGVSADSNGAQAVGQAFNGGLDSNTAKLDPWDFVPPPRSIEPQTDTPVVQSGRPTADTIDPLTGKNIAPQAIAFETMQKQKIVAADDMRGGLNAKLQPSLNDEKTSVDGARTSRTGPTQQFAPIVPQNQKASDKISSEAVDQQSGANAVSESKKVASASPSSSGGSNRSLAQSEKGFSGGPKEMKISESQDGLGFDNVLGPAVKSGVATGVESKIADLAAKVNDQIEPRVLQMAALASVGERKVLKMRLNPAELGTVEITLEKNTAGRISAIFHTETEGSQRILNQGLTQLRASLENAGCPIGNIEITCSSSNSNSGGQSETRSQQFGQTEDSSVGKSIIDGNSTTEDDQQERLVNLRA